jgi:hypothetical protein
MIASWARSHVMFGRFRTERMIMAVGPAFGGAARPTGRPLGLPA